MKTALFCVEWEELSDKSDDLFIILTEKTVEHALDRLEKTTREILSIQLNNGQLAMATALRDGRVQHIWALKLNARAHRNSPYIDVFSIRKNFPGVAGRSTENLGVFVDVGILFADPATGVAAEIAKACPRFSTKTSKEAQALKTVRVCFEQAVLDNAALTAHMEIVRETARRVDTPANAYATDDVVADVMADAPKYGLSVECIDASPESGLGGLWHVGKAAEKKPVLLIVRYEPDSAQTHVALVGKGIVYDTGGLCLKPRESMTTMKTDMAGAAAVYGAICAAASEHLPIRVTALLCLAENAIGHAALRPDDIIRMYSGHTVEINNTDAEGRLVLADGVAYASKNLSPDVIIDMATLTGAQLYATGREYAGVLTPSEITEKELISAGAACGEPLFPLLYAPDRLFGQFDSDVADMKNSVKTRLNPQSSCAGHFIEKHLHEDYKGEYAHLDIAGPAEVDGASTAYGTTLLLSYLRKKSI